MEPPALIYSEPVEVSLMEQGRAAIEKVFPSYNKGNRTPVLKDYPDRWEFTYEIPAGTLGGSPIAVIDKKTRNILRVYRTQ